MNAKPDRQNWRDIFFTSRDGIRLYVRHYPANLAPERPHHRPALCLPGLTRNTRDFHELACFLTDPANPSARDVYAIDYRGRGRSGHDPDWRNYTISTETHDVLDFMSLAGLHDVAVIGTSRGGLIGMLMATLRPTSLGAIVLNDIGPVIEREGLLRLVAFVGRVPLPASWEEAGQMARDLNKRQFPSIPDHHWNDIARQWFNDAHDRPMHGYDQNLGKAISATEGPLDHLWQQFEALTRVPVLAIRGEHSDILSVETFQAMRHRHPSIETWTVRGQGHAPLLRDRATGIAIADFLLRVDQPGAQMPQRRWATV